MRTLTRPGVPFTPAATAGSIPVPLVVQDMRTSDTDPTPAWVSIAPNASAHTLNSWTELIASTTADVDLVVVTMALSGTNSRNAATSALMFDLGVGAAGAEVAVVSNVAQGVFGNAGNATQEMTTGGARSITLPLSIRRGSRIAIRFQVDWATAVNIDFHLVLLAWPPQYGIRSPQTLDTIGATPASTTGVALSTTSNVAVEMSAATSRAYQGFVVCYFNNDNVMSTAQCVAVDVGVGASGAERWSVAGGTWQEAADEKIRHSVSSTRPILCPIHCPAGSRVAARIRSAQPSANASRLVLLGVPYA